MSKKSKSKSIDYRSFQEKGKETKELQSQELDKMWWDAKPEDLADAVTSVVEQIWNNDRGRRTQNILSMRLYGNVSPFGLSSSQLGAIPTPTQVIKDRLTYNVVQSAGDTVTAKIAKNKPKPLFLTSGGSYKLQRRAKKLDKFVEGIFYENGAHQMGPEIFRDCFVVGDGFTHVFAWEGKVKHERVLATELLVDHADALYGNPRSLHRIKNVDVDTAIRMDPDREDEIREAASLRYDLNGSASAVTDHVTLCESWHLPTGKKSGDGRHTIVILGGKCSLLDEEWEKDYFPFAKLSWSKRMTGYFSQGGAEQIQPIQLEINKILWVMQRAYQLSGAFKVWLKTGSKIVKEHINNEIGSMIYSDEMPQYLVPPIIPPEMYAHLKELKAAAFEVAGVSQLSAQSKKPEGLDSGKAIREYNNIETERFMLGGQAYEQYFVQLAELDVDVAKEIHEKDPSYSIKSPNARFIETIKWSEVDLPKEDMITKIFPVSSLPSDPSGRLQTIQEWVQAGWITPRTGKKLMDFPDLEMVDDLSNAQEDYLRNLLENIIDYGEYTPPEPFDDLALATDLFLEYYAQGKLNGLEQDRLEMLRQFNDQVEVLKQKAIQPPNPGAAPAPQADPMAAPQSELIPNVPQVA